MKKTFLGVLIITMMMFLTTVDAAQFSESNDGMVELQYVNASTASATLSISNGMASCTGTVTMSKNHPSKITMTLQRSKDKSSYSRVELWSQNYSGTGVKSLLKKRGISEGFYYRVRVVIRVYSGTEVIEKITKYSTVKYY